MADTLRDAGTAPGPGEATFTRARMVFVLARREPDAWLSWPPRVTANMAAELGVDAHRIERVLDMYLRAHLTEMVEVKIKLC